MRVAHGGLSRVAKCTTQIQGVFFTNYFFGILLCDYTNCNCAFHFHHPVNLYKNHRSRNDTD